MACEKLYQQKQYERAARCFLRKVKRIGSVRRAGLSVRLRKGRLLRNAITCLELVAKYSKDTTQAAYWREQAAQWIVLHNQEKLYEEADTLRQMKNRHRQLLRQIGYASLIVISNHPQARICVRGYKWRHCRTRRLWSLRVRPGEYDVSVVYQLKPVSSFRRHTELPPSGQRTLLFSPPYEMISIVTNDPRASSRIIGPSLDKALTHTGSLWSLQLPPGSYRLTLTYPHHPAQHQTFQVQKGQPVALLFQRPPDLPVLRIDSSPAQAQVFLNGKLRGTTSFSLPVRQGSYQIKLQKPCYIPLLQQIDAQPNKNNNLSLVLQRDPAYLTWRQRKDNERSYKLLSWVAVGLGAAATGLAIAFHITSSELQDQASNALQSDRIQGYQQYQELGRTGNALRTAGYVGLGVGALSVGLGVMGLFLASPGPASQIPCQVRIPAKATKSLAKKHVPPQPHSGKSARMQSQSRRP